MQWGSRRRCGWGPRANLQGGFNKPLERDGFKLSRLGIPKSRGADARRLKGLEEENRKLKKLLAESMLDVATLREALGKNF